MAICSCRARLFVTGEGFYATGTRPPDRHRVKAPRWSIRESKRNSRRKIAGGRQGDFQMEIYAREIMECGHSVVKEPIMRNTVAIEPRGAPAFSRAGVSTRPGTLLLTKSLARETPPRRGFGRLMSDVFDQRDTAPS